MGTRGGGAGAAIGGGLSTGNININISGGNVTASGGYCGIGGGKPSDGGYSSPCRTFLSWTDKSKDSMSITADSINDELTLYNVFKDKADGTIFPAVRLVTDLSQFAGRTLVPASDMHTVTFDTDGAGLVAPQAVKDGECAQEPDRPNKEGFRFIGWRVVLSPWDLAAENFDFSTPITRDVTLKAFYVDENEHNGDRFDIRTQDGAPAIDARNMADVVGATLTQAELDAGYSLLLVSSPLAEVPEVDRAALEGEAQGLGATPGPGSTSRCTRWPAAR